MKSLVKPVLFSTLAILAIAAIAFGQAAFVSGNGSAHYAQLATTIDLADTPTTGVALPDDARYALVQAQGGRARISTDERDPSAAGVGTILADGDAVWLPSRSTLTGFRAYELDAATELDIQYFKR